MLIRFIMKMLTYLLEKIATIYLMCSLHGAACVNSLLYLSALDSHSNTPLIIFAVVIFLEKVDYAKKKWKLLHV